MNKTIVSIWIDKEALLYLQEREEEEHSAYKYTLKMQESNCNVDSDITMSQDGLDLVVKNLAPHNSKEINLWTVWMHTKDAPSIDDATSYHFMSKHKADKKLDELKIKYGNKNDIYIIESTVE